MSMTSFKLSVIVGISLLSLLVQVLVLVDSQESGVGGGTCYEENSHIYACPHYNYTRYHPHDPRRMYEYRIYDASTWMVESDGVELRHARPTPIEGLRATYQAPSEYFNGANDKNMTISREVAPVSVMYQQLNESVWSYGSILYLPPMPSVSAPPNPTNSSVHLRGGEVFYVWAKSFSHDHVPDENEIDGATVEFQNELTRDGQTFVNLFRMVSFYDAIYERGNWTKEIWFAGEGTALPSIRIKQS